MVLLRVRTPSAKALVSSAAVAILIWVTAGIASGQAAAPAPISLDRIVAIARERAPAIAAARARVVQAEGRRYSRSVPPDPEVRGGFGRGEPRPDGPSGAESGLEIVQFLPSPIAVRARLRSGDMDVEASRNNLDAAIAEAVFTAKRLFYEAVVADAEASALAQAADDARQLQELMNRRVELGETSEGNRLRTRVEALKTESEARRARAEAEANRAVLNRFLLGALGATFSLAADLDPTSLPELPEDVVTRAVSQNPGYRASLRRLEAARWTLSAERALRFPGLEVSFAREREIDRSASRLTLGLSLPLWNRNEGAVKTAEGERAEAEAEASAVKARIEAEAERLWRTDRAARDLAISYRREILPAASEALSIARFSLEQGEANLLSWLEARRSYLEVLRTSFRAQFEAFLRRAEIDRLLGGSNGTR